MAGRHYTALGYCDEVDIENLLLLDIDNTFSPQVEDWIASAEKQVNRYLGYPNFASGILAESITNEVVKSFINSQGDLVIFPRKLPINSVSTIQLVRGTTVLTLTLTNSAGDVRYNIPSTNDQIIYPSQELSLTGVSTISNFSQLRGIRFFAKITYNGGYSEVPADIRLATANLVADVIMRHSNKEGLESITQGRVSKRWKDRDDGQSDFVKDAHKLLDPYRMSTTWLV